MFMIEQRYHPHTFKAVQTAFEHVGMVHYGSGISPGPLSPSDVECVERHLEKCILTQGAQMTEFQIRHWLHIQSGSAAVMRRDLAAEKSNGDDPRSDLALLLEMAVEGDL